MKEKESSGSVKITLSSLNAFITCSLCRGYLVDAVSITECLHTFCKSCIVRYLEKKNDCPVCHIVIHQSHPLNYISIDRTLQDIVYKVVPNLRENERRLREKFYQIRGEQLPPNEDLSRFSTETNRTGDNDASHPVSNTDPHCHRNDEQVNICLESGSEALSPLKQKYLRVSSMATVTHLRKFVAKKVLDDITKFRDIDICFCNNGTQTVLGKDHSLKFISVLHWRGGDTPMPLLYRPR